MTWVDWSNVEMVNNGWTQDVLKIEPTGVSCYIISKQKK